MERVTPSQTGERREGFPSNEQTVAEPLYKSESHTEKMK